MEELKEKNSKMTDAEKQKYKRTAHEGFVRTEDERYWKMTENLCKEKEKKILTEMKKHIRVCIFISAVMNAISSYMLLRKLK